MLKLQILMDEEKVLDEGKYELGDMYSIIDQLFAKFGFPKADDGFYLEKGAPDDFAHFWSIIWALKDQPWFLPNVKSWLWFNSDDNDNPADFDVEDLAAHYRKQLRIGA